MERMFIKSVQKVLSSLIKRRKPGSSSWHEHPLRNIPAKGKEQINMRMIYECVQICVER